MIGQDRDAPAQKRLALLVGDGGPGGKTPVGAFVVVHRQADLLEIVDALGAASRLAGRLHGRQQERDHHAAWWPES